MGIKMPPPTIQCAERTFLTMPGAKKTMNSSAMTRQKIAVAPASMTHQRVATEPAEGPAGSSTERSPVQDDNATAARLQTIAGRNRNGSCGVDACKGDF